jgi:hypothetical protein
VLCGAEQGRPTNGEFLDIRPAFWREASRALRHWFTGQYRKGSFWEGQKAAHRRDAETRRSERGEEKGKKREQKKERTEEAESAESAEEGLCGAFERLGILAADKPTGGPPAGT